MWVTSTNTGCNQWLSLAKIALKVSSAGRNRSLVANTGRCGEGIICNHIWTQLKKECNFFVGGVSLCGTTPPAGVVHTKFPVRFQPWNRWELCWGIDVGPSLTHYYSRRCWRMVLEVASVINTSRDIVNQNPKVITPKWAYCLLLTTRNKNVRSFISQV